MKSWFRNVFLMIGFGLLILAGWQMYREANFHPDQHVVIKLPQLDTCQPGETLEFPIEIQNLSANDLRMVGLNWC